jgi:hypothetical protein
MSATRHRDTPAGVLSSLTKIGAIALIVLVVVYGALSASMGTDAIPEGSVAYAAAYWYGTLLQVLFAAIIIAIAVNIGVRQNVGKQWLLVGLGVAAFAIGDIIWTVLELHLGLDPYPSVADVFYVLEYAFFVAAVVLAIRGYRALTDVRLPILVAGSVAIGLVVLIHELLLRPYIFAAGTEELGLGGLVVSTLYPLGDALFMVAPAIALALAVRTLGSGRLAWPWWIVVVGALVFAVTDAGYAYADWAGIGLTAILDLGWLTANLVFAIAALVARDAYRVR